MYSKLQPLFRRRRTHHNSLSVLDKLTYLFPEGLTDSLADVPDEYAGADLKQPARELAP